MTKALDHPRVEFLRLVEDERKSPAEAAESLGLAEDEVSVSALRDWTRSLTPIRSDLEKAVQTLGRLKLIDGIVPDDIPIDLSSANLQGFDLFEANLQKANLRGARMEGADLFEARMEGADLGGARMEWASLREARMKGADLSGAQMERADLSGAQMEGAYLFEARMEGADLRGARMEAAYLGEARMEGANLSGARMDAATFFKPATLRGAGLKVVDFSDVTMDPQIMAEAFGDATVKLPEGVSLHPDSPTDRDLDWNEFYTQWRAWQREHGYDRYQPPD
ncbi:pentapeptide repeat-containing protein [Pseudoruegeria sp. HB172150]|uniref:pentapeptide repeat-containing protein n=1 Tax=Pseudoruegeria sp. HB172150 TaxID=2721164 RepID=UPI001557D88B|nr:pentapeptide repeat-containing protein [Pseudoruegeria sp. HB172150]